MSAIAIWPTIIVVVIAAVIDLRSQRIPNWLTLPFLLLGVCVSAATHGWSGVIQSVLGVLAAGTVMGLFCYLGAMGMGDLKLCAAVGAWIGPLQLFSALVVMALAGAVMAIVWAIAKGFLRETIRGIGELLSGFRRHGLRPHTSRVLDNPEMRRMPYAPAIAIGTIVSFLGR